LFEEEFRGPLMVAWDEIWPQISSWQSQVEDPANSERLENAGLSGGQLSLKLQGLNAAWNRFKRRGSTRLLRNLLGWINAILGSLAQVIPGVEALKELKEAIEKLLAEDET
jgi:hypothetical protein